MPRLFRLLAPGARALALLSLFTLAGCSRAQQPPPAPPQAAAPPEAAAAPASAETVTNADGTLYAAAPHPTEGTNNPDAVIHSPVPVPAGETLRVLVPEGQNPAWLADALHAATGAKVEIKTYATDAEAVADLGAAPDAARTEPLPDLAALSDRAAAELIAKNALRPLPAEAVKALPEPAPEFLHHYFDPKSAYTWPYGFTLLGFAVNSGNEGAVAAMPVLGPWKMLANFQARQLSLPDDKELRAALWALAEAKPALADLPPEGWQKAAYDAAPSGEAGKIWVDEASKLRALGAKLSPWKVTVPSEGSLIFLYHWAFPGGEGAPSAPAVAAFRALADPAAAARLDGDAGLAVTQPAAHALVAPALLADPSLYPLPHALAESRFVRVPRASAAPVETVAPAVPVAPAVAPAK